MKPKQHAILLLFILFFICPKGISNAQSSFRLVFYNVENLFDTINNPNTNDDEYTPSGIRSWGYYKYKNKINNIYKVIAAICEYKVLIYLVYAKLKTEKW